MKTNCDCGRPATRKGLCKRCYDRRRWNEKYSTAAKNKPAKKAPPPLPTKRQFKAPENMDGLHECLKPSRLTTYSKQDRADLSRALRGGLGWLEPEHVEDLCRYMRMLSVLYDVTRLTEEPDDTWLWVEGVLSAEVRRLRNAT